MSPFLIGMGRLTVVATLLGASLVSDVYAAAADEGPPPSPRKLVLPGERLVIEGRAGFVFLPEEAKRRSPQPWVMYAPTLPGYPDHHEAWLHRQLTDAGIAVAGIDVGEAYGSPDCLEGMSALYEALTSGRNFASRPCLLGRSRGGLWVSSWAAEHPEKTAGIAGIYPVFDLTTYPGVRRAAPAYGLSENELLSGLDKFNPIRRTAVLAQHQVPVCIIHGDQDTVVPLIPNSQTLQQQYAAAGEADQFELMVPPGQGHNFWPGFFRCRQIADFCIDQARIGAGLKPRPRRNDAAPPDTIHYRDIPYTDSETPAQLLDVYRPQNSPAPLPVLIWIHGGGWKNGSKDRCPATWMTQHGYAVVSMNYRLTDQAQWPSQIKDCRSAVRWVRSNAKAWGFDENRVGVWGGSAGGHLAALLGTLPAPENEEVSSRPNAVCDWYGPTDLLSMPPNVIGNGRTADDVAHSNGAKLLGATVREIPDVARQASALYHASADDPPFLIMHGAEDPGVPLEQSQRLHDALLQVGVSSELIIIPGAGHGGPEFRSESVQKAVREFFRRKLAD